MKRQLLDRNHYFPPIQSDEWEKISPGELGWDQSKLDEALSFIRDRNSTALVILHKGKIVVEEYWQGWGKDTSFSIFSAGKSIISLAIGIAQEQGKLNIHDAMAKYLGKNWTKAPPEKEALITIRDVLTMTSGLDEELKYEAEVGTKWFYNSPAYWKLAYVIEAATGKGIADFLNESLWSKIGARNTSWNGKQVVTSARDMARFGLMVMNNGTWQGKDIIKDKAYLFDATNKSQEFNQSYGYLWWLNGGSSRRIPGPNAPLYEGSIIPSAPPDAFAALGFGDKKIIIVPSMEIVVMRHGGPAATVAELAASNFTSLLWDKLMLAMMSK
ncbi:MAG: beta-lactamase family protein [Dehalococcoidales bacterium]|nr:beta-lactamase family protein [Dehalococcoidales bacterium]